MNDLINNCRKLFLKNCYLIFLFFLITLFFYPFFLFGKIPLPADTIVGMYHPFRDVIWNGQNTGVPFKNFLITDPVRQQYVWRLLCYRELKKGSIPLWNPYSFSGTPLLANFQSACFYPLNILFFIFPFDYAWGLLVYLQPVMAGIFLFFYLRLFNASRLASFVGGFTFAFSGFSMSWLEWNTISHTALWLPLILFSIEKILFWIDCQDNLAKRKPKIFIFSFILVISLISSFFAGHPQIFFYSFLIGLFYLILRILSAVKNKTKALTILSFSYFLFFIFAALQWWPSLKFIFLSAREIDQNYFNQLGWFIPYQNLIQFIAPDFFGNPATNNYWGVWNYGEFIGYIGILPLFFALYALLYRFDKKIIFFGSLIFVSLMFSLPTPLAKIPYVVRIPFISTSQPTRLIFVVDFCLSVLSALGLDCFLKQKNLKKTAILLFSLISIMILLWGSIYFYKQIKLPIDPINILVTRRNLILPTLILFACSFCLVIILVVKKASKIVISFLLAILVFDLFRFAYKYNSFSSRNWIFPATKIIDTLKEDASIWRLMSIDKRIMPPNFSVFYQIEDIAGYDPLYLKRYGELISAWEKGNIDNDNTSFNRIITPQKINKLFINLLGVKYLLNLGEIRDQDFELILSESQTFLYKNPNAFPRFFLVEEVKKVDSSRKALAEMFLLEDKLSRVAVTEEEIKIESSKLLATELIKVVSYQPTEILLKTKTEFERLLVVTNIFYPDWTVFIDGKRNKIYRVNYAFSGIVIPAGEHEIELKIELL